MIWLFTRRKEEIRLETWYDKYTSEFVVDIAHPDGRRDSKRFVNDRVFRTWLATWDRQLVAQEWTQSGPFLSVPEQHSTPVVASPVSAAKAGDTVVDRTTRTYTDGVRVFEVTLSLIAPKDRLLWTVVLVTELSRAGKRLSIPGVRAIASPSPDAAFARACDCIDKWLFSDQTA